MRASERTTAAIAKAVAMARAPANMPGNPRTTDFSPTLRPRESRKQPLAGAVRPRVFTILQMFQEAHTDPELVRYPAAGVRAGPGTKAESSFRGHSIDPWARQPPRGKYRNIGAGAALR